MSQTRGFLYIVQHFFLHQSNPFRAKQYVLHHDSNMDMSSLVSSSSLHKVGPLIKYLKGIPAKGGVGIHLHSIFVWVSNNVDERNGGGQNGPMHPHLGWVAIRHGLVIWLLP